MNRQENRIFLQSVDSTNEYLKRNAADLPDRTLVAAKHQSAGKGRLGRRWQDKEGDSLLCSWLFWELESEQMTLLPLLAGLAVRRALEKMGMKTAMKWSNDVLAQSDGRWWKVAGILCESRIVNGRRAAICGIGINLRQSREFFESCGLEDASSLAEVFGKGTDFGQDFEQKLLEELSQALFYKLTDVNGEQARQEYSNCCITLHKTVKIDGNGQQFCAYAKEIAPDGSLVCIKDEKEFVVRAGEVSVRGIDRYAQ